MEKQNRNRWLKAIAGRLDGTAKPSSTQARTLGFLFFSFLFFAAKDD